MSLSIDEYAFRQSIPLERIQEIAIRISGILEEMNMILQSDTMNRLVTELDYGVYSEMASYQNRTYFGNQIDYIICYALLKKIGYADNSAIENIISRVIM